MKIIITKDKLRNFVNRMVNNHYNINNINYTNTINDDYDETDEQIIYYLGDYEDGEVIFRLYKESYWNDDSDFRKKLSPLLFVEDIKLVELLTNFFGDRWKPFFIEWFEENFDEKVKTIDHY
jgi:hypothetical protein